MGCLLSSVMWSHVVGVGSGVVIILSWGSRRKKQRGQPGGVRHPCYQRVPWLFETGVPTTQPDFEKNTDLVLHLTDEKQAGERPPGSSPAPDLMPAHLHEVSVREDQARERGYWHSSLEGQAEVGSWRILSSPRDLHHVSRWRNP